MARRRWTGVGVTAGLWLALLIAAPAAAADETVTIDDFAFAPGSVTVQVGDTVTWDNQNTTAHTATDSDGAFDTGSIGVGETAEVTFQEAGTYAYICSIHPAMTGTIVVEPAGAAPTAAPTDDSTAPPTDALVAGASDPNRDTRAAAAVLAVLGSVMLVGTVLAERRFRSRSR